MATQTPNYNFELPTEGSDDDVWGGFLNTNWSSTDTILQDLEDRLAAAETAIENQKIKIGDLYLSTDATDPATKLGYGTWEAHGEGRALVGVGDNGASSWIADEERGAETHVLTTDEMPLHGHTKGTLALDVQGNHTHGLSNGGTFYSNVAANFRVLTQVSGQEPQYTNAGTTLATAGAHSHNITGDIGGTGGNQQHNNVQPSIAVYVWKRVA